MLFWGKSEVFVISERLVLFPASRTGCPPPAILTRCLLKSQSLSCHQLANCVNIFPVSAAQSALAVSLPAMVEIRPPALRDLTGLPLWWLPQPETRYACESVTPAAPKSKKSSQARRPPPAVLSHQDTVAAAHKLWGREHQAGRGADSVQSMMGKERQHQPGSWPHEPTRAPCRERRFVMRQTQPVTADRAQQTDASRSILRRLWEQETRDEL